MCLTEYFGPLCLNTLYYLLTVFGLLKHWEQKNILGTPIVVWLKYTLFFASFTLTTHQAIA